MRNRAIAAITIALLAACGGVGGHAPGNGGTSPAPDPDRLVLRVDSCCGFVSPDYTVRQIPSFSLFVDGRVLTPGPQIEIYPGPALPNIQQTDVDDDGVQAIVDAAHDAGLSEAHDWKSSGTIADAPMTIFTLVDPDGTEHVTRVYALTEAAGDPGMPPDEAEARKRLNRLLERLGDLRSWLPEGSVGEDHQFQPTSVRVYARRGGPQSDQGLEQAPRDWPLAQPLATFGQPVEGQPGTSCGALTGSDAAKVLDEAGKANELTPWRSGAELWTLLFRPLLPDESGC